MRMGLARRLPPAAPRSDVDRSRQRSQTNLHTYEPAVPSSAADARGSRCPTIAPRRCPRRWRSWPRRRAPCSRGGPISMPRHSGRSWRVPCSTSPRWAGSPASRAGRRGCGSAPAPRGRRSARRRCRRPSMRSARRRRRWAGGKSRTPGPWAAISATPRRRRTGCRRCWRSTPRSSSPRRGGGGGWRSARSSATCGGPRAARTRS